MDQGIDSNPLPDMAVPEQVSEVSEARVIFCECGSLRRFFPDDSAFACMYTLSLHARVV